MTDRVLIVCDEALQWYVRRVRLVEHRVLDDRDEKIYYCDEHLGGPFPSLAAAAASLSSLVDWEAKRLVECAHSMAFPYGEESLRCPHCGAMKVGDSPWCFPHLVKQFAEAWQKSHEPAKEPVKEGGTA